MLCNFSKGTHVAACQVTGVALTVLQEWQFLQIQGLMTWELADVLSQPLSLHVFTQLTST